MKTAVLTVVHPSSEPYFHEFLYSLSRQTDPDFTIFLINDGIHDIENILQEYHLSVRVRNVSGTPSVLRKSGIEWIRSEGAKVIVFADSDDCFSENRIETSKEFLSYHDIVLNELVLFGKHIQNPFPLLKNRLAEREIITRGSIEKSNCMGLSNTAMRTKSIPQRLSCIPDNIIAFDWAFFSLCLHEGAEAVFTGKCTTFYRQHENNIASPQAFTNEQVLRGVRVKREHYRFLARFYDNYSKMSKEFIMLFEKLDTDSILREKYCEEIRSRLLQNFLWWEPIRTLQELGL
ncbi:MAG: glycosyltransferase family A protein [Candidatus Cloacimonadia bacterium]